MYGNNNIGIDGARCIADALKENNTLKVLALGSNNIGDEGARFIADMLAVNKTLQEISLSNNSIGDAQSIATSLVVNKGIRKIWLRNNEIGDDGAEKLADVLESNHDIKIFWIDGNNISNHTFGRIKAVLKDDKRGDIPRSPLDNLEMFIEKKDKELESKDAVIAKKDREIAKKEKRITSLEAALRLQFQQIETIIDPIDLTTEEDTEPPNKRARLEEETPKSALALQHEQNQQYSQRLVQVKQEKNAAEANLQDVREELEDSEELIGQQAVATNIWQGRFDELVSHLESGQEVDGASIAAIRNRSLASGS